MSAKSNNNNEFVTPVSSSDEDIRGVSLADYIMLTVIYIIKILTE